MQTRTEIFWNKYITGDGVLAIYDDIYEFFSQKIPKQDFEEYDFVEVVLETFGHHETGGEHQKAINFIRLIQNKQAKLYQEVYPYADEYLINYYCFDKQMDKAGEAFANFIKTPDEIFDKYLSSFKRLLYYGNREVLDKAISKNYKKIGYSNKLINEPERDLAISKLLFTLEDSYKKNPNKFDKRDFLKLKPYGFADKEEFFLLLESAFSQNVSDIDCTTEFIKDRFTFMIKLQIFFLKFMYERGFPFAISGTIWNNMFIFWEEQKTKNICAPSDFFPIKPDKFKKYLSEFWGFMTDNSVDMVALVWGFPHIFDFLKSLDLISQRTFDKAIELSRVSRAKVIADDISYLWSYGFVHTWSKPDTVLAIEFEQEVKIFKKSLTFGEKRLASIEEQIGEELDQMGDMSKHIRKEAKKKEKRFNSLKKDLDMFSLNDFFSSKHEKNESLEEDLASDFVEEERNIIPVRTEQKIGRNDPCHCGSGKKYKKCCAGR